MQARLSKIIWAWANAQGSNRKVCGRILFYEYVEMFLSLLSYWLPQSGSDWPGERRPRRRAPKLLRRAANKASPHPPHYGLLDRARCPVADT